MSSPSPAPLRKYRIERYLAEGGMGAIYVGKKLGAGGFEKEVVLKQLLPEFTSRPEFRDLFFREAKISGSLDHTNIVRTYDLVRSDDALFIVMEYVRGADLRTICWRARLRGRPLSTAAIVHVCIEILAGLAYAHSRSDAQGRSLGIIHRDVSPSNILCSGQGDVKLSDFGIAKASSFVSVFYRVRGKVGYMSPEQARNQPIDGRSDLFSLAVCLHEALTGERLFVGDLQTPPEQVYRHPIARVSERDPQVPADLDVVMGRALATDVRSRYQTAEAFAGALRQVAERHGLAYSALQLADELRSILGPNPETWVLPPSATADTQKIPLAKEREGKEAASLASSGLALAEPEGGSYEVPAVSPPRPSASYAAAFAAPAWPAPARAAAEVAPVFYSPAVPAAAPVNLTSSRWLGVPRVRLLVALVVSALIGGAGAAALIQVRAALRGPLPTGAPVPQTRKRTERREGPATYPPSP